MLSFRALWKAETPPLTIINVTLLCCTMSASDRRTLTTRDRGVSRVAPLCLASPVRYFRSPTPVGMFSSTLHVRPMIWLPPGCSGCEQHRQDAARRGRRLWLRGEQAGGWRGVCPIRRLLRNVDPQRPKDLIQKGAIGRLVDHEENAFERRFSQQLTDFGTPGWYGKSHAGPSGHRCSSGPTRGRSSATCLHSRRTH